jgi:hypothetical protein
MKLNRLLLVPLLCVSFSVNVLASDNDRPEHFKGLMPKDIKEAVEHFSEYNAKLGNIIAQKHLSPEDLHTVHELTYTIENALGMLSNELGLLAETLEAVHIASEHADPKTVQEQGQRYIDGAKKIIK